MKFFNKVYNFIRQKIYTNETVIIFELKSLKQQNSKAIIKNATFENLKDILYFQNKKYINIFKDFLNKGDKGYFAYIDNNCIHRSWIKSDNQIVYPHWALPYNLKDNEVFIHYCETAPEARGQNIYSHVLSHVANIFKDKNILISVNKNNISSIKGVAKVGFIPKEEIQILIILGFRFTRYINNDK